MVRLGLVDGCFRCGVVSALESDDIIVSVWYCIPSARPAEEAEKVLKLWRERGYKIALWCDTREDAERKKPDWWQANHTDENRSTDTYPGYARAVNELVHCVMEFDPQAEWFVTGGDDIHPDLNHTAKEIAKQCSDYFATAFGARHPTIAVVDYDKHATFGVMQPTGDRWGDAQGAYADRVCGSPWMGREFCRRIYGGCGPIWPEFTHMFEDEHLQCVAEKLGILWQRPDLIHYHEHWVRKANDAGGFRSVDEYHAARPKHLRDKETKQHWDESKAIFERLKAGGFKEAEDLLP